MEAYWRSGLCRICGSRRPGPFFSTQRRVSRSRDPKTIQRRSFFRKWMVPGRNSGRFFDPNSLILKCSPTTEAERARELQSVDPMDYWQLTIKELKSILRDNDAIATGNKAELIERVLGIVEKKRGSEPPEQTAKKTPPKKAPKSNLEIIEGIPVEDAVTENMELVSSLNSLTVAELKNELKDRGQPGGGRKMELVARLAKIIQAEESLKRESEPVRRTEKTGMKTLKGLTTEALKDMVKARGGPITGTYEQLMERVERYLQNELSASGEQISREAFEKLLNRQELARLIESQPIRTLRKRLDARGLLSTGTRAELIVRLEEAMRGDDEVGDALPLLVSQLREWHEDEKASLEMESPLVALDDLPVSDIQAQLEIRNLPLKGTETEQRKLLELAIASELHIPNRALVAVVSGVEDKMSMLPLSALHTILGFNPEESPMQEEDCYDIIVQKMVPEVMKLFDEQEAQHKETIKKLEAMMNTPEPEEETEEPQEILDQAVTVAVLFGGDHSSAPSSLDCIRCMLDHLQTAPFSIDEGLGQTPPTKGKKKHKAGIRIVPYLIYNTLDAYRLTTGQVFALDAAVLEEGGLPPGDCELVGDLPALKKELKGVDLVYSMLTSSTGVCGKLRQFLDGLKAPCVGTDAATAQVAMDRYLMTQAARNLGYPTVPMFRLSKGHLEDKERWFSGLRYWCSEIGKSPDSQFVVRPSGGQNVDLLTAPEDLQSTAGLAYELVTNRGCEQVVIEPFLERTQGSAFQIWVIETEAGPVALLPTELEVLYADFVRPMASPIRHNTPAPYVMRHLQAIRLVAAKLFKDLGLRDFARVDGLCFMDNRHHVRKQQEELPVPRPIPDMAEELTLEERDEELDDRVDNVWSEIQGEINEWIEGYESTEVEPDAKDFDDWAYDQVKDKLADFDIVEDLKALRDSRIESTLFENKMAEVLNLDEVPEGPTQPYNLDELDPAKMCDGKGYNIAISSVTVAGGLEYNSTLFQQAAAVGISHSSVLRHITNRALQRAKLEPLVPLPCEPRVWNPLFPDLYPLKSIYWEDAEARSERLVNGEEEDYPGSFLERSDDPNSSAMGEASTSYKDESKDRPQQVWVLFGGDGTGQHAALASGVNAFLKLRRSTDLQVYPFLLAPNGWHAASPERLEALIYRRKRFLKEGVPENVLRDEYSLEYIRNPEPIQTSLEWCEVWALDYGSVLQPTVDEVIEYAKKLISAETMASCARSYKMDAYRDCKTILQRDLIKTDVTGVGALWGDEDWVAPPPPRSMTVDLFAEEAAAVGAVVYLAIPGGQGESGAIQSYLDSWEVIYTGSGVTTCALCVDKNETASILLELDPEGISTPPKKVVKATELVAVADDSAKAQELYSEISTWLGDCKEICVKPSHDGCGGGVARLADAGDLQIYARAVATRDPSIEQDVLTPPHSMVVMANPAPDQFVMEPYIRAGTIEWDSKDCDTAVLKGGPWLEVTFGLLGDLGQMRALTPSILMESVENIERVGFRLVTGQLQVLTPVPESICKSEVVQQVRQKVEQVADRLALKGVAQLDAFMNTITGEIIVLEVDTSPNLSANSPILQQAALEDPPIYPDDFFRHIVEIAASPQLPAAPESSWDEGDDFGDDTWENVDDWPGLEGSDDWDSEMKMGTGSDSDSDDL